MTVSTNPLSTSALSALAQTLLPSGSTVPTPLHALALLIHSVHAALGFRLAPPLEGTTLPESWSDASKDSFKLEYKHSQSSLTVSLPTCAPSLCTLGSSPPLNTCST